MSRTKKILLGLVLVLGVGAAVFFSTAPAQAGRIGGPLVTEVNIAPKQYEAFVIRFQGNKMAKIGVQNAGLADLDLVIIDPQTMQVVAQDKSVNADAKVQFFVPTTKQYIVIVHNYSPNMPARYVLFTN